MAGLFAGRMLDNDTMGGFKHNGLAQFPSETVGKARMVQISVDGYWKLKSIFQIASADSGHSGRADVNVLN
ncbi:hypothetical protein EXU85_23065 [Spirosoma sp. KCTC 42546]|nr:hypothetical protein EXU85_23065 [Spirosoma sp. KCTC 42546]